MWYPEQPRKLPMGHFNGTEDLGRRDVTKDVMPPYNRPLILMTKRQFNTIVPVEEIGIPLDTRVSSSIIARMLFPIDNEEQNNKRIPTEHTAMLYHHSLFGDADDVHRVDKLLASRKQLFQVFRFIELTSWREIWERRSLGIVAGDLLNLIVWMNIESPGQASLKKAQFLAAESYRSGASGLVRRRMGPRSIAKAWSEFRSVSHLWAGYIAYQTSVEKTLKKHGNQGLLHRHVTLGIMENPRELIAYSINYLDSVCGYTPKHRSSPIVDLQEVWLPPVQFVMQDQEDYLDPRKLYTGLDPKWKSFLANYKHI